MKLDSIILQVTLAFLSNLSILVSSDRCCRISSRESPMYKLSHYEKRSTMPIISQRVAESLEKCEKFAISKKALAFNYRIPSASNNRERDRWNDSNCQALECPVTNDPTSWNNDTRFNYYSSYGSRMSTENGTLKCLPGVGIFFLSNESSNYTNARESCRTMNATLAHIASEERTEGLGKIMTKVPTFVGLSNRDAERLWKNEFDEPLSCFDYRGWAKNEPANSRGCVVLVSPEYPRFSSSWRVAACSQKFPYVCEIKPRSRRRHQRRRNVKGKSR